jgi:membrane fusion protein, multidrug efflux system
MPDASTRPGTTAEPHAPPDATTRAREAPAEPRQGTAPPPRRWYRRRASLIAIAIVLVLAAVGAYWYWTYATARQTTDDAYIEARVIRISPRVTGHVARVAVDDNQEVTEGQLLLEIDDRQYRAALEQARARGLAAEAEARRTAADAARARRLYSQRLIARADLDQAETAERTAVAQVEATRAEVARRELDLQFTRVLAPEAGRVTNRTVEEGMFVQVGQPLMAIVTHELWVVAHFKETQIGEMGPGQPVEIRVDAFPGKVFRGRVDSIQRGTGARFSLLPPENASGNFVKVVQRVPVKIVFDEPPDPKYPIGPGMSVVPTVKIQ